VTVSQCEWTALTAGGTNLAPPPNIGIPAPSAEGVIYLHDPHGSNPSNCPTLSGGMTAPGGFGWLTDTAGPCDTTTTVNTILAGDSGTNTSAACTTVLASVWSSRTPLMLPVFDTVTDSGSNTTYHITGFSMFVLTGYKLGSDSKPSWLTGRNACAGGSRCLYGYFSTVVMVSNGPFTTTNFGVSAITLVG
jgi:hypothetical protein